ncbi:MAG: UDP-N-acetylmuramoyl-tripeptide--D-alanyl-D-alanine ligase [Candidatus Hydrogenedentes bacterium]|nr:UDP-N-acetylmuramoyl-tripeptide--D-alanyl-D-alanine ligase [Candidatus Hydrogenedentota bacterium]
MGWNYTVHQLAEVIGAARPHFEAAFSAVSTDTRTLRPGDVFFALSGENFDGNLFAEAALANGAAAVVTTRTDPTKRLLTAPDPLKALQQFAAWHRAQFSIPVIAITGSCGKTTAKNMIAAVLETEYRVAKTQGNLNNEIGCPVSLLQIDAETECAVLEMGANHRREIAALCAIAKPTESAITMIGAAHLEGFGSEEQVAKAKAEIVAGLPANGLYYVNTDNDWCARIAEEFRGRKIYFGNHGDVVLRRSAFAANGELELEIDPIGRLQLPLPIRAHVTNVLLAIAVGLQHGVTTFEGPLRAACASAARFKVRHIGPFTVLDDTYNANPISMAAAVEALAERPGNGQRIAVLGDMLELGNAAAGAHARIGALAAQRGISHLIARGAHACDTINAARAAHLSHAEVIQDHQAIAQALQESAGPGDTILVKGSRGMRMEKVIDALAAIYQIDGGESSG